MDVIRRNTDYALRLMINLARNFGEGPISSKILAEKEDVSYQLTCKLMQKLNTTGLVKSQMGQKGGFILDKKPSEITLAAIVDVIQGPVTLNSCLHGIGICPRQSKCPVSKRLAELQEYIGRFFKSITLSQFLESTNKKNKDF
jgi:Rrf2 family iron-sulfur cluster assembly transcriptional regulator